eukprot:scaffold1857_cov247-Pinguiococcus_pyrenoidosus.AAC.9
MDAEGETGRAGRHLAFLLRDAGPQIAIPNCRLQKLRSARKEAFSWARPSSSAKHAAGCSKQEGPSAHKVFVVLRRPRVAYPGDDALVEGRLFLEGGCLLCVYVSIAGLAGCHKAHWGLVRGRILSPFSLALDPLKSTPGCESEGWAFLACAIRGLGDL